MNSLSIFEQLLFSTISIESETEEGFNTGTGFFFKHKTDDGKFLDFLVTNKHVIQNAKRGYLYFIQKQDGKNLPQLGCAQKIPLSEMKNKWYGHPDKNVDVCILPIRYLWEEKNLSDKIFQRYFMDSHIPSKEHIESFDAVEEILFIGYPDRLWDPENFVPITRRGITATPPSIDFNGEKRFLIDASVFPGSSGSPVVLYRKGLYSTKDKKKFSGEQVLLLGIVSSGFHLFKSDETDSNLLMGLGSAFKSSTIIETIDAQLNDCKKGENI